MRLQRVYLDVEATAGIAGMDGLSVIGGSTVDKEVIETILQETCERLIPTCKPY
ncbi:DinI-like family protein [Rouxiella badensis]|uniref:DinI-like family protein n=1 Tax=Rouxiella badensis TaxID=1646377 RepID=UPI0030B8EAB2